MWKTSSTIIILVLGCLNNQVSFAFQTRGASLRVIQTPTHKQFAKTLHYRNDGSDDNRETEGGDETNALGDKYSTKSARSQDDDVGFSLDKFIPKEGFQKLPPLKVEDVNVLFYDVFLLVNLSLSISFWVTHRLDFAYLPSALNEGCIFSLFWILAGLYHGSFLMSAVDGHYGSTDERSGPKAAAALGLTTYVSAVNMRLVFALASAVLHHRQVGGDPIEQLIPLEVGCGVFLMTMWRGLHSYVTPRI